MAAEECTARFDPVGIPLARKLERNNGQKSGMFNLIATTPWKRAKFSVPENLLYANSCPKLCFTQTGIARRQLVAKRKPPKGGEKIMGHYPPLALFTPVSCGARLNVAVILDRHRVCRGAFLPLR
jgi:hypothetical protein